MCGICGIAGFTETPAEAAGRLTRMVEVLRHRGPDQSGVWTGEGVALGHARLSIIDLSDGRQPIGNEDGTVWITYNGEVYNFQELRDELISKGHRFQTRTDTEVIVHLFEEEGIECVRRLRGMFAFGVWDGRSRQMYLARDRLGIKPLYYTVRDGRLIFGSEIKAILAHGGVAPRLCEEALSDYLTFLYVPAPKTIFRDIHKLEPGHWLRFQAGQCQVQQYWDLEPAGPWTDSREALEERLVAELGESVRMRLVSDVPLGAFLSGGVDSSSVVAMMAAAGQDPLVTLSIGFQEQQYDELPFARRVAQRYRTEHHESVVRAEAAAVAERLAWHFDEPFSDYSSIPTYYVSREARRRVTVALSGDGGDENFAGYRRYRFDLMERRLRRVLPGFLRRWVVGPAARLYPKADWLPRPLRAKVTMGNIAADAPAAYCRSVSFLDEREKQALFADGFAAALGGYSSTDVIRRHMCKAGRSDLNQLLYTDIKTYLVDDILTKVDRSSMAVSLEVRVPLLDHRFVEFAQRVPPEMKIEGRRTKAIMKSALRNHLDDQTLHRPKQGFTPPIVEWLRGPLREMAGDLLLCSDPHYGSYLKRDMIETAWRRHMSGVRNNGPLLWAVLTFELWARRFAGGELHGPEREGP